MTAAIISWSDDSITSEGETNSVNSISRRLQFDAIQRLARTSRAEVTQYTVESGAPLTDHKHKTPRVIVLDGLVTNQPIAAPPPSGRLNESSVTADVSAGGVGNVLQFSQEFNRIQDVYNSLQELVESPVFVTLETDVATYERVTVTSVENIKTTSTNAEVFTVTFQEIFVGETQTVDVPIPTEPRGSRRDESASSTQTTDDNLPQSWALNIGQGVGLFD